MVLEVMGRYAGWIALYSGVAGGADVILMPEIPFQYESICRKIQEREQRGRSSRLWLSPKGLASEARITRVARVEYSGRSTPGGNRRGGDG